MDVLEFQIRKKQLILKRQITSLFHQRKHTDSGYFMTIYLFNRLERLIRFTLEGDKYIVFLKHVYFGRLHSFAMLSGFLSYKSGFCSITNMLQPVN